MHELSLMSALVEQVTELSIKERFDCVNEIRVSVGILSGVDPSCLDFCFSEVTQGSILSRAKLVIETVPMELNCENCGKISISEDPSRMACSWCESNCISIVNGREFKIIDLEVDSSDPIQVNVLTQVLVNS